MQTTIRQPSGAELTRTLSRARPGARTATRLAAGALALGIIAATLPSAMARPVPESFADLVEKVAPAVVNISTVREAVSGQSPGRPAAPVPEDHPFRDFFERFLERDLPQLAPRGDRGNPGQFDRRRAVSGLGSGFVVDPEGYVVTNNHVIAQASEITVTLSDGTAYPAEVIGRDDRTDLALLKVEPDSSLPSVSFGNSDDLRPGDWVVAVGNPYGLGGSVTAGIVSARGRDLRGGALNDFIQVDAPINRGNSGGPSFDSAGNVIGINTAIYSPTGGSVGIGFAIPSNVAAKVIDDLRDDGRVERGWLGVRIQPVTPDIAEGFGLEEPRGALVASVEPNSPAAVAGLTPGDVVTAWNGAPIRELRDLPRLVAETTIGHEVEVELWRERATQSVKVTTGEAPQRAAVVARSDLDNPAKASLADLGISLADDTVEGSETHGVQIVRVAPGSVAERQGLRAGDRLAQVGGESVDSAEEAAVAFARAKKAGDKVVTLMISRDGETSFLALRLPKDANLG